MTWRAAHQSPDGVLRRFTFASREPAAMALYTAMSRCGSADAWGEMRRLAASTADFIARIDGHWFALSRGDTDWAGSEMSSDSPCVVPSISGSVGALRDGAQNFPRDVSRIPGAFSATDPFKSSAIRTPLHEGN